MRWRSLFLVFALLLTAGCVERSLISRLPIEAGSKVPYRLQLEFESDIPDPYTVLSGPMETYDRFPVASELEKLLGELLRQKETPAATEAAIIRFHFKALTTNFDQFGALFPGRERLAMAQSGGRVLQVNREGDGSGGDLPSETWRGAALTARVTILVGGVVHVSEVLKLDHQEIILRDNFYPWMSGYQERFDFHRVFEVLLRMTAGKVGEKIDLTLGGG